MLAEYVTRSFQFPWFAVSCNTFYEGWGGGGGGEVRGRMVFMVWQQLGSVRQADVIMTTRPVQAEWRAVARAAFNN